MKALLIVLTGLIVISGCESTSNKGDLQSVNTNLRKEIALAKEENNQLLANNTLLTRKTETLNQVITVLDTEKGSRVEESSILRSQVRKFVQNEIDSLKRFLVEGGLLDYVGGELVERSNTDENPLTIVDLSNRVASAGVLTGMGAYVMRPTSVKIKVLRNIENNLIVVWESNVINMSVVGPNRHQFTNSIGVEKGDVIAYEFETNLGVGYNLGTGDSRYSKENLSLGTSINVNSLMGIKEKRSYSIGVYGLLNQ